MAAAEKNSETLVIRLWLEIDLESEPISGTIRVADEAPKPFLGWLGLTSLLETVRKDRSSTGPKRTGARSTDQRLTQAERDIVNLVCEGLTNPQIAQRLSVSPRTIQGHLLNVFRKLKVSTRAELVGQILRAQMSAAVDANAPSGSQGPRASSPTRKNKSRPDANSVTGRSQQ